MSTPTAAVEGGAAPFGRGTLGGEPEKLQLKVGGMHCSLCTDSIRRAVGRLVGVRSVEVSIAHEEALVEFQLALELNPANADADAAGNVAVHQNHPDCEELVAAAVLEPTAVGGNYPFSRRDDLRGIVLCQCSGNAHCDLPPSRPPVGR